MKYKCKIDGTACRNGVTGECLKEGVLARLAGYRGAVVCRAQRALLTVLLEVGSANADDMRRLVELPPGISPKCFGSAPGPLAKAGIIRADGFCKTSRPKAHARPVTVWRLNDRSKAEQWLADHPDRDDNLDDSPVAQHGPLSSASPSVSTEQEPAANIAAMKGINSSEC